MVLRQARIKNLFLFKVDKFHKIYQEPSKINNAIS